MKVASRSDVGKKRSNNEDCILVDKDQGILLLADGMGGHQAGEVASSLAVRECYAHLRNHRNQVENKKSISRLLIEALFKAHDAIKQRAKRDLNLMGMGTTLIAMIIRDSKAHVCHVGDSRVYLIREGIKQITRDHTLGDYLVEHEKMMPGEVSPSMWHTLTQAVGESENLFPDISHQELKEKDLLLLCSDGLTDMVTDKEIELLLRDNRDNLHKLADALIEEANNKGGRDNVSVILVHYEEEE